MPLDRPLQQAKAGDIVLLYGDESAPTTDFADNARNSPFDIGAFEYLPRLYEPFDYAAISKVDHPAIRVSMESGPNTARKRSRASPAGNRRVRPVHAHQATRK